MSFLLLSGALLTLNPVYPIGPECYYATYQALMQVKKADNYRSTMGIMPPGNTVGCNSEAEGIELAMLSDYEAAFDFAGKRQFFFDENEQHNSFNYSQLFVDRPVVNLAMESVTNVVTESVIEDDRSLTEEDSVIHSNDGDGGGSVFSVMNATIPTASAPPPVWQPLLKQTRSEHFIFPLTTPLFVTSPYGLRYHPVIHSFMRHEGTDFRAASNSEVMSIADGVVLETGYGPVTGFFITVRHADGWSSRYLHLNQLKVSKNQYVQKGNVIGLTGNTGRTNGPHLHLEMSHNDRLLDPMTILFEQLSSATPVAEAVSKPEPVVPESIDMPPKIAVVAGEGEHLQIGIRIGRRMSMYHPNEMIETDDGNWRIVKKFGKYKLLKIETSSPEKKRSF